MSRLLVLCEGHTETEFVKVVLRWHLAEVGYHSVAARLFGYHRSRARRGGIVSWPRARRDILRHLKQDSGVIVTTMVDYYGLPSASPNGWPGRQTSESESSVARRAAVVEAATGDNIAAALGPSQAGDRFVPFVMFHDFEALLFSDCRKFADAVAGFGDDLPATEMAARLEGIRRSHATPEEIDDDPRESPSKRIQEVIPGYRKRSMGPQAARAIGIPAMMRACPHFASWIERLSGRIRSG